LTYPSNLISGDEQLQAGSADFLARLEPSLSDEHYTQVLHWLFKPSGQIIRKWGETQLMASVTDWSSPRISRTRHCVAFGGSGKGGSMTYVFPTPPILFFTWHLACLSIGVRFEHHIRDGNRGQCKFITLPSMCMQGVNFRRG